MLVYQPGQLERTARSSALQVRQRSDGLKDVSSPGRLRHLNIHDNKAEQKRGISTVSVGACKNRGNVMFCFPLKRQ